MAPADGELDLSEAHGAATRLGAYLVDVLQLHQGAAVYSDETRRAPTFLEDGQGYAYQVAAVSGVQPRVVALGLDIAHLRALHEAGDPAQLDGNRLVGGRRRRVAAGTRPLEHPADGLGQPLGTGLLDPDEAAVIAARLGAPDLDSGYGLRTLTTNSPRFSPLSYHGGAVWPHDTAIAARGLLLEGQDDVAAALLTGLLAGAGAFDNRLPELYAGVQSDQSAPLPYPASCRPQAWSAAAGTCVATLALGLRPDVPNGRLTLRPSTVRPWGELSVDGLRLGSHQLSVTVRRDGSVAAATSHPEVTVITQPARAADRGPVVVVR